MVATLCVVLMPATGLAVVAGTIGFPHFSDPPSSSLQLVSMADTAAVVKNEGRIEFLT